MSEPIRYVVLSEGHDRHHVAVARCAPATGWVQIIATFPRRERAEDYAEIENQMLRDSEEEHGNGFRDEDHQAPPVVDDARGGVSKAIEFIETHTKSVETRNITYLASSGQEKRLGSLSDEILKELPVLIEEFPKGPTSRIIAERLCVEEHFVRKAVRALYNEGRAMYGKRLDSTAHHLWPLNYEPPEEGLTPSQRAVFETMSRIADSTGVVNMAKRRIALTAGISVGSVQNVLDALERRGRIVGADGRPVVDVPHIYRVIPGRDQVLA